VPLTRVSRSSLRLTAQLLVATAEYLKLGDRPSAIITLQEVEDAGSRWPQRVSPPPIENPRLSRRRFIHSAIGWLTFLSRLEIRNTLANDRIDSGRVRALRRLQAETMPVVDENGHVVGLFDPMAAWRRLHSRQTKCQNSSPELIEQSVVHPLRAAFLIPF
jgi:hypothetical protein